MDFEKIFHKDACPTSIGGQAIMEGIMMRGPKRTAIAVRLPDGKIHMKTQPAPNMGTWGKIPLVRGVAAFVSSLVFGTKVLMYSADVLEKYTPEDVEPDKFDQWVERKFGKEKAWNILLWLSVVLALVFSIGVFMLLPTAVVGVFKNITENVIILNIIEGLVRIGIFIGYIALIPKLEDINTVFQYHGAEHKTIHCYENGLELTPENAQTFYTLHPRCGTSFLMFVMIIAIIVHVFMGWPNVWMRVGLRLLALPLIAGISYELLKWAGRSNNKIVEFLSLPGIYLQKLTTREPSLKQLEVAIAAMKAVIPEETEEAEAAKPYFEGICDLNGEPVEGESETYDPCAA
ncbi:MAG: DUF1385 domain-containing protein [Firmicutes bacterium]|nr:DUF1385 domain-containing protein [Bacillota bacterium]